MPRIPDKLLDGIAFLYPTVQAASNRQRLGGTAFLVGRPLKGSEQAFGHVKYLPYLVSNRHVVFEGSAPIASMNRKDGGLPDVWDIDQEAWVSHPDGDDVAATCVQTHFDNSVTRFSFIPEPRFATRDMLPEYDIGVGDEVFMIGRFVNLQGRTTNRPSARFGSLSMMLEEIQTRGPLGPRSQTSYAVEMRSRTGFSGSPVCIYRTLATALTEVPSDKADFWALLGVNWGYIIDEEGENTWLNGVVPAWKISEVLDQPPLAAIHAANERYIAENADGIRSLGSAAQ